MKYPKYATEVAFANTTPSIDIAYQHEALRAYIDHDLSELESRQSSQIYLLLAGRELGKTSNVAQWILDKVNNSGNKLSILIVAKTKVSIQKNWVHNKYSYLALSDRSIWQTAVADTVYTHRRTGSIVSFASMNTKEQIDKERGTHPDILVIDESQMIDYDEADEVFGEMGKYNNCLKIYIGSGSSDPNSLASRMTAILKENPDMGISRRISPYTLYKINPCIHRYNIIKTLEKRYDVLKTIRDQDGNETSEVNIRFFDNDKWWREVMSVNVTGSEDGELVFTEFKNTLYPTGNIITEDIIKRYNIDISDEVIGVADVKDAASSRKSDAYCLTLFQVRNGRNIAFAEMYSDADNRSMATFAAEAMIFLQGLGFDVDIDANIPSRGTINAPNLHIFLDHHGRGRTWIDNLPAMLGFYSIYPVPDKAVNGIEMTNMLFKENLLLISEACPNALKNLPIIRYEIAKNTKSDTVEPDSKKSHSIDTILYYCQTEFCAKDGTIVKDMNTIKDKTYSMPIPHADDINIRPYSDIVVQHNIDW